MDGLTAIAKERHVERLASAYRELAELFPFVSGFHLALFDQRAAAQYTNIRTGRGNIGASDLKNAAVAITQNALLLTANCRDFGQIHGLKCED